MSTPNPYAAPKAPVADETLALPGRFVPGGQARPAGSGTAWIADGWRLFMKSPGIWIAIVVVMAVIMMALNFIPFVGAIAVAVLTPIFGGGLMLGCRALDEGNELEFGHLFAGFRNQAGALATVGAIYLGLAFAIGVVIVVITGASMLTVMGGGAPADPAATAGAAITSLIAALIGLALLVPVAMLMWFAPALVVLNQLGAVDALKQSWSGCVKNIVPFLIYGVVLFVLAIIATLPLMLGWLVLGPVLAGSVYASYRDIYIARGE
ncbi:MAG TPA: BPSS1780 family membrane protein [Burkholderiales bacterium]